MPQNQIMNKAPILLTAAAMLWITGCATHKARTPSLKPAEPMVQVIPPQGAHEPRVAEVPSRPEPIYINPVIEEVEMASYINDDGNLVFPGKVLVIREPGHWNLAGAQKNSRYYVPADNQPPQLAPTSKGYYDYIQSKRNGHVTARLDVSRVRVLGYAQKEEQKEAESKLFSGETTAYDPYLGWLAIPDSPEAEEAAPNTSPTAATPVSSEKPVVKGPSAKATPAPADQKQPEDKREGTNAPPAGVPAEGGDFAKEQEKKLRGILEDAFKKAAQAHEQGTNQPNQP
jgi:hypothetical protein